MAISSINFAKSSGGSFAHNDRSVKGPDYLLPVEHRLENECNRSAPEAQKMLEDLFENAKENYSKTYGQKFQTKFENAHWEAVVNLNKEHTIKDVERLAREIEKETGFTAVQISIHRDEGRLNEKTGHPIYNLHAHVNFSTLDKETGRQLYRRSISNSEREKIRKEHGIPDGEKIPKHLTAVMDKEKLSKLQDITARELGMERGLKGSDKVRLGHKQYRATEQEKEKLLEKIDELQKENAELKYNFRDMQKQITALDTPTEDKKELHRLNTEINKIKIEGTTKDLKISELEAKLTEAVKVPHEPINARLIGDLKSEVEMLQISKRVLENELKETKSAPVPKGENVASKQIERYVEEMPKSATVQPKTDELELRRFENGAEAKEAKYRYGDEYAKRILEKHTNIVGKVDKEALIKELGTEFKETATVLNRGLVLVNDFKSAYERTKSGLNSTLKSAKTALEDVYSKIVGKSLPQVQNERTEQLKAIHEEKVKQAEAQQAKDPEQVRSPSRGRSLRR